MSLNTLFSNLYFNWRKMIKRIFRLLCLLSGAIMLLVTSFGVAYAVPKQIKLNYELSRDGKVIANITETFSQDGKQYRIKSVTKGVGVYALLGERKLLSEGNVTKDGLKPKRFEVLQSKNPDKALINDFDWKSGILRMQVKGEPKQEKLEVGTQDLLSVMYQFMFVPPKDRFKAPVSIGKKLSAHEYIVSNQQSSTQTRAGNFKSVALKDDADEKTIYLATDKQYIPIKIEMRDDNKRLVQTLTKVKFN